MKIRTILLTLVIVLMSVFLILNWQALMTPQSVDLVYTTLQAPLGAIVVVAFGVIVLFMLIYMILQQAAVTMELRAASKEVRNAHQIAEDAEKSRFAETKKALLERMDNLESMVSTRTEESLVSISDSIEKTQKMLDDLKAEMLKMNSDHHAAVKADVASIKSDVKNMPVAAAQPAPAQNDAEDDKKKKEIFNDLF